MPDQQSKPKRRPLKGMGADIFFDTSETKEDTPLDNEPGESENRETVLPSEDDQVVKTSFYPTQGQLDKLDDLAGEYNKRYRRQRKKIDRQDIIRFLIERCDLNALTDLQI